jgi:hypothetical protein
VCRLRIADRTATHAFATIAYASNDDSLLWYVVVGASGLHVRSWKLTKPESHEFWDWEEAYTTRLAAEPAPEAPRFSREPEIDVKTKDGAGAIAVLAHGDEKLDFSARDLFHVLWPTFYPRVTDNERPNLFEATRLS